MPNYDIWDLECSNLVDSFPSEEEALAMVRRAIEKDGPQSIEGWALGRTDHVGEVLAGGKLIDRAKHVPA